jgi:SAM-dependent methyltransferase
MPVKKTVKRARRAFVNAGCGPSGNSRLPAFFRSWRQIRVDIDPTTNPDLLSSIADLSAIPKGTVDAVWSAHCLEHLYAHEVPSALSEFRRVLRSSGFACIVIPDLQAISEWIASDRLFETIYYSASGPVNAHDMIWGFGRAIAAGNTAMAHRCGFTPTSFIQSLTDAGFAEIQLRRKNSLELVALALCRASKSDGFRESMLAELGF